MLPGVNRMRSAARLLECLRGMDSSCETMSDFLTPAKFDMVLRATIKVSGGPEESLLHPSTALKYRYDLQEIADIEASVFSFIKLKEKKWRYSITSLALEVISERNLYEDALEQVGTVM